jgi:hypothetical protein
MSRSALRRAFFATWAIAFVMVCAPAAAQTYHVTDGGNAGAGTLRQVLSEATEPGDVVEIDASVPQVVLTAQIEIEQDAKIVGQGPGFSEIAATGTTRLFQIGTGNNDIDVTIEEVRLAGGRAPNGVNGAPQSGMFQAEPGSPGEDGGAIRNRGRLILRAVTLDSNEAGDGGQGGGAEAAFPLAPGKGGNGGRGGAIANEGTLTLIDSTVTGNAAGIAGAAGASATTAVIAQNGTSGGGGGIWNAGTLSVTGTTFIGNMAADGQTGSSDGTATALAGSVGGFGGAILNEGVATIGASTFNGNAAGAGGIGGSALALAANGGNGGGGGAIHNRATLRVTNSTLADNAAGGGGIGAASISGAGGTGGNGGFGGAIGSGAGEVTIAATTIAVNAAGDGGSGGFSTTTPGSDGAEGDSGGIAGSFFVVRGSVLALNTGNQANCSGVTEVQAGTLAFPEAGECDGATVADPRLDPEGLEDNGGPTPTIALQQGSGALGLVPDASCTDAAGAALGVDQRGVARPAGACDAGAFQLSDQAPQPPPQAGGPTPIAKITKRPKKTVKAKTKRAKVRFFFSSDTPGAGFQCKLDRTPFTRCTSPLGYRLMAGRHTFRVRALAGGQTGPEATASFKVKRVKKRGGRGR